MNLSPEAQKYFSEHPQITIFVDPGGDVWELAPDPWHPEAFVGCGEAVESVMCSEDAVKKAGPRKNVWMLLDYWGNAIGKLVDKNPPGFKDKETL